MEETKITFGEFNRARRDGRGGLCYSGEAVWVEDQNHEPHYCEISNPEKALVWLNVYHQEQCYGGPEEGGWWYDWRECELSIPMFLDRAIALRKRFEANEYSNEGMPEYTSVLSEGKYLVYIELERAESQSRERPHYC